MSLAVSQAFLKSAPWVKQLSAFKGPYQPPEVEIVEKVCAALWDRQGKRLRSHLVYWFGDLYAQEPAALNLYAWAAEAVHTATLLHDDVIDQAQIRRGAPSANHLFDNTLPVLSGDFLLGDAVQRVAESGHPLLLQRMCRTLKELVSGECLQYQQRYRFPADNQVFEKITRLKTTSLLQWCAIVAPTLAGADLSATQRFTESFGLLFQFSDDMLDVLGSDTKGKWTDLRQGSLNHVTFMLVRDESLRRPLEKAFARKAVGESTIRRFDDYVRQDTRLVPVYRRLNAIARQAEAHAGQLPPGATTDALKGLVRLCVDRCS